MIIYLFLEEEQSPPATYSHLNSYNNNNQYWGAGTFFHKLPISFFNGSGSFYKGPAPQHLQIIATELNSSYSFFHSPLPLRKKNHVFERKKKFVCQRNHSLN